MGVRERRGRGEGKCNNATKPKEQREAERKGDM